MKLSFCSGALAAAAVFPILMVGCAPPLDDPSAFSVVQPGSGSGGANASGGSSSSGGATGSGGIVGSGGVTSSGGMTSSGGATGSGGARSGGATGSGGSSSGGATGSGGVGTGGRGTGGGNGTGGRGGSGTAGMTAAGGGTATFAAVTAVFATACVSCHNGTNHTDLRAAGLYARIVGASSAPSTNAMCTSQKLIVANNPAMSLISNKVKGTTLGGCGNIMPAMCSATSANPRACLTAAQIATIDGWINAGAPM